MAKNYEKFTYIEIAVPKSNIILLHYLQEIYEHTNMPASQMILHLATERVKQLCGDEQSPILPGLATLVTALAGKATETPPVPAVVTAGVQPVSSIQSLDYDLAHRGADDEDMDLYGDPD